MITTRTLPVVYGAVFGLVLAWVAAPSEERRHPAGRAAGLRPAGEALPRIQEEPLVEGTDWKVRDLEGRWVFFLRSVREDPKRHDAWIKYLERTREAELLEMIAIYHAWEGAGAALIRMKAPQWMRVHVWHLGGAGTQAGFGSHGVDAAQKALLENEPGKVLAWMGRNVRLLPVHARGIMQQLAQAHRPVGDGSAFLPPLTTQEVLRDLSPPDAVLTLTGPKAKAGHVYVHQVERALSALALLAVQHRPQDSDAKLRALARHPSAPVRRAALLGFTSSRPQAIPAADLIKIVNGSEEDPTVREAAALALGFSRAPRAWLLLHQVATDPAHPAFKGALSRLADVGNGFTREHLDLNLLRKHPEVAKDPWVRAQIARINPGILPPFPSPGTVPAIPIPASRTEALSQLERAARALQDDLPFKTPLRAWTIAAVAGASDDHQVFGALQHAIVGYGEKPTEHPELKKEMRRLALAVMEAAGR